MKHKRRRGQRVIPKEDGSGIFATPKSLPVQHILLKFFISITLVISSVFILSCVLATNESKTGVYIGKQTFNNREEAEVYQCDVYKEAFAIGAGIERNIIIDNPLPTVHFYISPPVLRYSVFGNEPVPFKYGKAGTRVNSITALVLTLLFIIASIWFIWSKSGQRMFAESEMWQDGTLVFAVSLIPCILLVCSMLYVVQVFILEKL